MIKRIGGAPLDARTADRGGKYSTLDDVQRLLVEQWRRSTIKGKLAAKQRRLVSAASVDRSSPDEITVVTRIGRLRLLWRLGRTK